MLIEYSPPSQRTRRSGFVAALVTIIWLGRFGEPGLLAKPGFAGQIGLAGGKGFAGQTGSCWPNWVLLVKPGLLATGGLLANPRPNRVLQAKPDLLVAGGSSLLAKLGLAGKTGLLGK